MHPTCPTRVPAAHGVMPDHDNLRTPGDYLPGSGGGDPGTADAPGVAGGIGGLGIIDEGKLPGAPDEDMPPAPGWSVVGERRSQPPSKAVPSTAANKHVRVEEDTFIDIPLR
jgi:hypothetical protein